MLCFHNFTSKKQKVQADKSFGLHCIFFGNELKPGERPFVAKDLWQIAYSKYRILRVGDGTVL